MALALGALLAFPALAAAAQTFAVTSQDKNGFPAGGHPTYTTTVGLDTSAGGPKSETITLAPGVLASLAAAPNCLKMKSPANQTPACQVGTGSATTTVGVTLSLTAYLAPPPNPATDVAGIDLVTSAPGNPTTNAAVDLVQTPSGNVSSVIKADLSSLGTVGQFVSSISTTIDGTLANGQPFTRMPTNCSPGASSVAVTYANATTETTNASPDFAVTGCAQLPFAPRLTASAVKDAHDGGAKVVTKETQSPGEAAGSSTTLALPWPALASNLGALAIQNTSTPVGTAVTTSPLLTTPLSGKAYLTGGPFTPTLTLRFLPPSQLTLVGTVSLTSHSVTFSNLPDVPQSSLVVTLFGGVDAAETASCAPPGGILHGAFTGQNGASSSTSLPLTVSGCPATPKAPTVSGARQSGLAAGKPAVSFKLTSGSGAPKLKSFTVSLSGGLKFIAKKLAHGVSVTGPHTLKLAGGTLTVTLKRVAGSVAVKVTSSALSETSQLRQQARKHKSKLVKLHISITDAAGSTTTRTVSI
jgi:hypothetical protein